MAEDNFFLQTAVLQATVQNGKQRSLLPQKIRFCDWKPSYLFT
ncbi:MAG: hypothetical protein ACHBN1_09540 [Heteroscytonema crispum UTEX LB 1556]